MHRFMNKLCIIAHKHVQRIIQIMYVTSKIIANLKMYIYIFSYVLLKISFRRIKKPSKMYIFI